MGKSKRLLKEHDRAVVRLAKLLVEVEGMAMGGPLTVAEVVGNLEAAKHIVLSNAEADLADDCDDLDDLFEALFGKGDGDEA